MIEQEILSPTPSVEETIDPTQGLEEEVSSEALIDIKSKPLDQLEPIQPASVEGNEFWGRRKLRPDGEGSNFHNMPVLRFGIDFAGDEAILSLPSLQHLNKVAEQHNPGGFTFAEVAGTESANDFLDMLSSKVFPLSQDRTVDYPETHDLWLNYIDPKYTDKQQAYYGQNLAERREMIRSGKKSKQQSMYEHDLVDHMAITALPTTEADKLARFAALIRSVADEPRSDEQIYSKDVVVSQLDLLLEDISAYAIIPSDPGTDEAEAYKEYVWGRITTQANSLSFPVGELLYPNLSDEEYKTLVAEGEEYDDDAYSFRRLVAEGQDLVFDRGAFDDNIRKFQALEVTGEDALSDSTEESLSEADAETLEQPPEAHGLSKDQLTLLGKYVKSADKGNAGRDYSKVMELMGNLSEQAGIKPEEAKLALTAVAVGSLCRNPEAFKLSAGNLIRKMVEEMGLSKEDATIFSKLQNANLAANNSEAMANNLKMALKHLDKLEELGEDLSHLRTALMTSTHAATSEPGLRQAIETQMNKA